jgi:hypothetical protein
MAHGTLLQRIDPLVQSSLLQRNRQPTDTGVFGSRGVSLGFPRPRFTGHLDRKALSAMATPTLPTHLLWSARSAARGRN